MVGAQKSSSGLPYEAPTSGRALMILPGRLVHHHELGAGAERHDPIAHCH